MSHIKSRKHVRPTSTQSLTAATLLTGLALGLPAVATAATPAFTGQTTKLDKVVVKGQRLKQYSDDELASPKFTQPLLDTTQTINIIGSDLFNEQGATTLTEALRNSPGVGTFYVGENGSTTTGDAVRMRGFDSSSSIFVDGVRDMGSITRDVFNIEQIEVAKGPAGTDYGRSSPTGAINLVTKQPFLHNRSSASVSLGSADQKRVTADLNRAIGNGGSAFRLNLMAQDSGVPGRDSIENDRWGIAPSLAFGLDTATRTYINFLHIEQNNTPDGGVSTIGLPGYVTPDPTRPQIGEAPRVDTENFYGTTSDYDDVTADMLTLRIEHDFSDTLHLRNTTRWGRTRQDYLLTSYRGSADHILTPDINDPSTWLINRSIPTFQDQRNEILTNQTNLRAHFDNGGVQHDLSVGLELIREKVATRDIEDITGSAWPAANLYNPQPDVSGLQWAYTGAIGNGRTDTVAVYAFDTITFNPQWELNAGVRLDHYDTQFSSLEQCGGRRGPDCGGLPEDSIVPGVNADISDTLFTWKLGVLYKPSANGSIYANYAIAQQPPGGESLELSSSARRASNPIYDPQESNTAELGTKWSLVNDRLMLTAAIYNTEVSNEVVRDPVDRQYYQIGEKRVRGIELSAVGHITTNWAVSAGFTTMDAEVTAGPAVTEDGTSTLAYTPDHAFTAWSTYTFESGLSLGGGARYSGEMKRGSDGAVGTPTYTEDYWVFDAVASYAFNRHFSLRLNAYNLFDEDYVAAINKSGYRYTPGAPRSFLLTANFHF